MKEIAEVQEYLDKYYFKHGAELEKAKALLRKKYPGVIFTCKCLLNQRPNLYIRTQDLRIFITGKNNKCL